MMTTPEQRFSIGYHLNSWDLGGLELEPGLRFLAAEGFRWFEALARDGFSNDFARRSICGRASRSSRACRRSSGCGSPRSTATPS
jgi:hypothetical protein